MVKPLKAQCGFCNTVGTYSVFDLKKCRNCGSTNIRIVDGPIIHDECVIESKGKFVLEFNEAPALVFVQRGMHPHTSEIYQDGVRLKGVRSITIRASLDNVTTHEIEYLTGATKPKGE